MRGNRTMRGRIISFTSHSGGVGRTMALANVAWLLATAGMRVLAVDWNLRAPGLPEFFHPFWPTSDPRNEPGVIDELWQFVLELYRSGRSLDWREAMFASTIGLAWKFPREGSLDLLNSGRSESRRLRTELFPYKDFFRRLNGQYFVECMRAAATTRYDFVLIDAPLLFDEYSGICCRAVPDVIAVCFTLFGSEPENAAAAYRAVQGTAESEMDHSIAVLPVVMRTESVEKQLLEEARTRAAKAFQPLVEGQQASEDVIRMFEVPYFPYYSYRRALAFFEPSSGQSSLCYSYQQIARHLLGDEQWVASAVSVSEARRVWTQYASSPTALPLVNPASYIAKRALVPSSEVQGHFFVSYKRDDWNRIVLTVAQIQALGFSLWWDEAITGGTQWREEIRTRIGSSRAVIFFFTRKAETSIEVKRELSFAREIGKLLLPIMLDKPESGSEFDLLLKDIQQLTDPGGSPSRQLEAALRELCLKNKSST